MTMDFEKELRRGYVMFRAFEGALETAKMLQGAEQAIVEAKKETLVIQASNKKKREDADAEFEKYTADLNAKKSDEVKKSEMAAIVVNKELDELKKEVAHERKVLGGIKSQQKVSQTKAEKYEALAMTANEELEKARAELQSVRDRLKAI